MQCSRGGKHLCMPMRIEYPLLENVSLLLFLSFKFNLLQYNLNESLPRSYTLGLASFSATSSSSFSMST